MEGNTVGHYVKGNAILALTSTIRVDTRSVPDKG